MASFSSQSKLKGVAVKKGNAFVSKAEGLTEQALITATIKDAKREGRPFLLLYDGAPKMLRNDICVVCFTSPTEAWREETRHIITAEWLYMPLWTLDELHMPSNALGLDIDDDKLADQFDVFGGEARACLHPHDSVVEREQQELERTVSVIRRLSHLKQVFLFYDFDREWCRVIHFEPSEDAMSCSTRIASAFVERELLRRVLQLPESDLDNLLCWLDRMQPTGALGEFSCKIGSPMKSNLRS